MANTLLTPTMVTREALRVLHQKLNFIGNVNRQYDDAFSRKGAKIGTALNIRLPNQYTVRTGSVMSGGNPPGQDTAETSVQLNVTNQKGIDLNFTSIDLTMALDDFSDRIIQPAMAVLASTIESDMMNNVVNDIYQQVTNNGSSIQFNHVLQARKILSDSLAPMDNKRCCNLNTQDNLDLVDFLKGLFQDSDSIAEQYTEGSMGRTGGFNFYENTLWATHTVGTKAGTPLSNGVNQTGASLVTDGWTAGQTVLKKGDIFTIAGVFKVHPETKNSLGILQQFVATADGTADGSGNLTIPISPAIVATGPTQNVSNAAADNSAIAVAGAASTAHGISMAFHRDAFVFATADLEMPYGVDWASRQVLDGVSMRIVRAYDINNDKFPCRLDVLYGYKTVRPQLAVRLANK